MAVSISMIFYRCGGVSGSLITAALLDNYCEYAFYLSGSTVLGNNLNLDKNLKKKIILFIEILTVFVPACAFLAFFIPKIHQKAKSNENIP